FFGFPLGFFACFSLFLFFGFAFGFFACFSLFLFLGFAFGFFARFSLFLFLGFALGFFTCPTFFFFAFLALFFGFGKRNIRVLLGWEILALIRLIRLSCVLFYGVCVIRSGLRLLFGLGCL